MSTLTKLRRLFASGDAESCLQAIELAKSLGEDMVEKLLTGARVGDGLAEEYAMRARAGNLPWSVTNPQHVVAGMGTRGPYPMNELTTLALAEASTCAAAKRLRDAHSLVLSGQGADGRVPISLGVLRGFDLLESLCLVDALALERGAIELPNLKHLVIHNVDSFDLGAAQFPKLRSVKIQTHHMARDCVGPRVETLRSLERLAIWSNASVVDVDSLHHLTALRTLLLFSHPIREVPLLPQSLETLSLAGTSITDLGPLRHASGLRYLQLGYCQVTDWSPLFTLPQLEKIWCRYRAWELPLELRDKHAVGGWLDRTKST